MKITSDLTYISRANIEKHKFILLRISSGEYLFLFCMCKVKDYIAIAVNGKNPHKLDINNAGEPTMRQSIDLAYQIGNTCVCHFSLLNGEYKQE